MGVRQVVHEWQVFLNDWKYRRSVPFGSLCLVVAAAAAAGAVGTHRSGRWPARLLALSAVALGTATVRLGVAFVQSDFSVGYVADHSRTGIGAPYRLAGLWGGLGGSLLLWIALLAVVGWIGVRRDPVASAVVGFVVVSVVGIVGLLVNPFETLAIPRFQGGGLTPILEHPAMVYHPPLLYLGLVATVVPFALAIGSVASGRNHADAIVRWVAISWTLLTAGLATGANWAYVELGWGGYWAWDPVENTALLPWLTLTAAMHWRSPGRGRTALAVTPFALVVYGALLTRSGATASVHAFAEQRDVGIALGALTAAVMLMGAAATVRVGRSTAGGPARRVLVVPTLLVVVAAVVVLVGTSVPIVGEWFGADERVIRGSFYTRLLAPVVLVGLAAAIVVHADRRTTAILVAGGSAVGALGAAASAGWPLASSIVFMAAAALAGVMLASIVGPGLRPAVVLGHLGIAVLLLGVAGTTAAQERRVVLAPGEIIEFGGHRFEHVGVAAEARDGLLGGVVSAEILIDGQRYVPSLISYPDAGVLLAETSLVSTPLDDVQVALRNGNDNGQAEYDLSVRPLAMLVWWGAALLAAAGVAAIGGRRQTFRPRNAAS